MTLRDGLKVLPSTRVNDDGTLNLWHVRDTGLGNRDYNFGRLTAALLISVMRKHDTPGPLYHVLAARMAGPGKDEVCFAAFLEEVSRSIMAAHPANLPLLSVPLPRDLDPATDPCRIIGLIPFATRCRDRGPLWRPVPTGDQEQDMATGRHLGAVVVHLIHRTRWKDLLYHCTVRMAVDDPSTVAPIFAASDHVVAEAAMTAGPGATPYQQGAEKFAAPTPKDSVDAVPAIAWA